MRQWVGSILFTLYLFVSVPIYGALVLLTAPLPRRVHVRAARTRGSTSVLWLLRVLCRLDYLVEGASTCRRATRVRADQALVGMGDDRAAQDLSAADMGDETRAHVGARSWAGCCGC